MVGLRGLKDWLIRREYARITRALATTPPQKLLARGRRDVLKAFHRAARQVPAYKRLLAERGVDPADVTTIEQFHQRVPIVDKHAVFASSELAELCTGGRIDDVASFHTSSGRSGVYSFGVATRRDLRRAAIGVEYLLDRNFDIFSRKTLLINCNAMGVKVPTRTLAVAETSVRANAVLALVRTLGGQFDQFILNGESPFLKKLIEDGVEAGLRWKDMLVHVVTGGEFLAENYRSYIAHLLGIDPDKPEGGMIGFNMGLSELSLSIFCESAETIRIRRAAGQDRRLRCALFGQGVDTCPELMQYHPSETYVESIPDPSGSPQLVVSMLDRGLKIPLIRYNTGDTVETMTFEDLRTVLARCGCESLLPGLHLPLGIIWGKKRPAGGTAAGSISQMEVKEALYRDFDLAGRLTGNFRIEPGDGRTVILVQGRPGAEIGPDVADRLGDTLRTYVDQDVEIRMLAYRDFPYGIEHNYEQKNQYASPAT